MTFISTTWIIQAGLLILTLAIFSVSFWLFRQCKALPAIHSLLHPLVTAPLLIGGLLLVLDIDYSQYRHANSPFFFLLGTATVALAIPLHQQFHHIRTLAKPLLLTLLFGANFAVISALAIAWALGASVDTLISLTPKSVTTPIALGITEKIGGQPGLTAGIVVFTGVVGAICGPWIFRWLKITDDRIAGFVMGISAHGIGTARAFEISSRCGAFSSLGLGLTGTLTAILLPWIVIACSG
jgi:predicted murein hydrolase (TIGR00659 family)